MRGNAAQLSYSGRPSTPYPSSPAHDRFATLVDLAIISSALLLIVIDMTVLYTALPTLTRELGATASQKLWIINIYALIAAGLLLGMGTLGDRLGHKRLFIGGLSVFGLCSYITKRIITNDRQSMDHLSPSGTFCMISHRDSVFILS